MFYLNTEFKTEDNLCISHIVQLCQRVLIEQLWGRILYSWYLYNVGK
jgi:hypothetical protein